MTRKLIISAVALLLASVPYCFAQMTDEAVAAYIAKGVASGKSKSQLGKELMSKGVTTTQAQRLMQTYQGASSGMEMMDADSFGRPLTESGNNIRRTRKRYISESDSLKSLRSPFLDPELEGKKTFKLREDEDEEVADNELLSDEVIDPLNSKLLKDKKKDKLTPKIYGHDIFRNKKLSFEPNENSATPASYVMGAGDELIIDVWGVNEATIKQTVSPEGKIFFSQVGPVQVAGLTLAQATQRIKSALSRKYSLGGANPASQMSVSLANIRSIQVNVLGEVKVPGTYRLSSLSNVFNALYRAGGVTEIGSLRNIKIMRGGEQVGTADVYKFLFDGSADCNVSLSDGDAVIVPAYTALAQVKGGVKRPMYYEVIAGEPVGKVLEYAGGMLPNAFPDEISVERKDFNSGEVSIVKNNSFNSFGVQDGDIVTVYTNNRKDLYDNKIEVKGSVVRPGVYALGGEIATVRQLVEHAGGLLENAFRGRAQIIREKADRSLEVLAVAIGAIVDGSADDVILRKNDLLVVSDNNEIDLKGDLTITGYVINPGIYEFADGMSIEDLILLAGGLESGASSARVDVSRRIMDSGSTEASDTLARVYTFSIKDGLMVDGKPDFVLKPFDVVAVRKSPTYVEQKRVRVSGEATFPGEYTMTSNNDRISDLFKRAGLATPNGYVGGAMLKRKVSEDERNVRRNMGVILTKGAVAKDTTKLSKFKMAQVYTVGIELDKAMAKPGSQYDVILHDGDELIIPARTNTVRVQGEVLYPNAVNYLNGKSVRYYVNQSGGFDHTAVRRKVFVVHMNGEVTVGLRAKVEPGSEIVVPAKPENNKVTLSEWLGIGSTAASITTMVATVASLINR